MKLAAHSKLPSIRLLVTMDAVLCALFSGLLLLTAPWLADATDLPVSLLRGASTFLIARTAFLVYASRQPVISRSTIAFIVLVNVAWVLGSVFVIVANGIEQNGFGTAFVLFQSLGVLLLAMGQYLRLKS